MLGGTCSGRDAAAAAGERSMAGHSNKTQRSMATLHYLKSVFDISESSAEVQLFLYHLYIFGVYVQETRVGWRMDKYLDIARVRVCCYETNCATLHPQSSTVRYVSNCNFTIVCNASWQAHVHICSHMRERNLTSYLCGTLNWQR